MSFLRRGRFLRSRLAVVSKLPTSAKWPVDSELEKRQMEKRAELVSSGKNVDRAPLDYEKGLPIG